MPNSAADHASTAPIRYRGGTLRYATFGVVMLFIWMLRGDFSFSMMGLLIPNLPPLFLNMSGVRPVCAHVPPARCRK